MRLDRVQRVRFFQYTIDLATEYGVPNKNILAAFKVLFGRPQHFLNFKVVNNNSYGVCNNVDR